VYRMMCIFLTEILGAVCGEFVEFRDISEEKNVRAKSAKNREFTWYVAPPSSCFWHSVVDRGVTSIMTFLSKSMLSNLSTRA